MTATASGPTGVLLMTFGSATTAEGVHDYVASLRAARGAPPPAAGDPLVEEFEERYRRIGRSPLVDITAAQARALQALLDERAGAGRFHVATGMLHSEPRVAGAAGSLFARAPLRTLVCVTLAPQFSPLVLSGYVTAVEALRAAHPGVDVRLAGAWCTLPAFVDSIAERTAAAMESAGAGVDVVFTAHSLPLRVVRDDPEYLEQLRATAAAVAARLELPASRWRFAWQSAGHTPEEWLKPDLTDAIAELREAGATSLLVAPVQFVADHLEILYDLDVAAREQAESAGMRYARIEMPNTSPAFITALADVVERELAAATPA